MALGDIVDRSDEVGAAGDGRVLRGGAGEGWREARALEGSGRRGPLRALWSGALSGEEDGDSVVVSWVSERLKEESVKTE